MTYERTPHKAMQGASYGTISHPHLAQKSPKPQALCVNCAYYLSKKRTLCHFTGEKLEQDAEACSFFTQEAFV